MPISQAEYIALLTRLNQSVAAPRHDAHEGGEGGLHDQILDECRGRGWIALHGSTARRTRRTIGEPDFTILADGGVTRLVECKVKGGKLSTGQAALHCWAAKLGHTVHVVTSLPEFISLFPPSSNAPPAT